MALQSKVCRSCRSERLKAKQSPRTMVVLPTWTEGNNKNQRRHPVYVCEYCDGPVLAMAKSRKASS